MKIRIRKLSKKSITGLAAVIAGLCMGSIAYAEPLTHTITENDVD